MMHAARAQRRPSGLARARALKRCRGSAGTSAETAARRRRPRAWATRPAMASAPGARRGPHHERRRARARAAPQPSASNGGGASRERRRRVSREAAAAAARTAERRRRVARAAAVNMQCSTERCSACNTRHAQHTRRRRARAATERRLSGGGGARERRMNAERRASGDGARGGAQGVEGVAREAGGDHSLIGDFGSSWLAGARLARGAHRPQPRKSLQAVRAAREQRPSRGRAATERRPSGGRAAAERRPSNGRSHAARALLGRGSGAALARRRSGADRRSTAACAPLAHDARALRGRVGDDMGCDGTKGYDEPAGSMDCVDAMRCDGVIGFRDLKDRGAPMDRGGPMAWRSHGPR